jgi:hypothetical protein
MRERDHLGDAGVDGRIILRGIFRKRGVGYITTKTLSIITRFKLKNDLFCSILGFGGETSGKVSTWETQE